MPESDSTAGAYAPIFSAFAKLPLEKKASITQHIVARGNISVNGSISSANSNRKTTFDSLKSCRSSNAATGAYAISTTSPTRGIASLAEPRISITMHRSSFVKSNCTGDGASSNRLNCFDCVSDVTLSIKNFPCDATTDAITTKVILAKTSAAIKYGSLDDSVDQKVFDLTTVSVRSDPSNTATDERNEFKLFEF